MIFHELYKCHNVTPDTNEFKHSQLFILATEDGKLERNAAGALFKDIKFICYMVRNPDWDLIYASQLQFRN